jgi:SAM-dependent methyltransferase
VNIFDDQAENYSATLDKLAGCVGQDHDAFIGFKARLIARLLRRNGMEARQARVLDVGCGIGLIDRHLVGRVGQLEGIDVSEESIRVAERTCPGVRFQSYDGAHIPHETGSFDLAFACCVFHHIPPEHWRRTAGEMARILKPGGLAVIIEHNPLNPVTRHIVRTCALDEGAVLLRAGTSTELMREAGLKVTRKKYITFLPFQSPAFDPVEQMLGWLPLGAQYFVAAAKI